MGRLGKDLAAASAPPTDRERCFPIPVDSAAATVRDYPGRDPPSLDHGTLPSTPSVNERQSGLLRSDRQPTEMLEELFHFGHRFLKVAILTSPRVEETVPLPFVQKQTAFNPFCLHLVSEGFPGGDRNQIVFGPQKNDRRWIIGRDVVCGGEASIRIANSFGPPATRTVVVHRVEQ